MAKKKNMKPRKKKKRATTPNTVFLDREEYPIIDGHIIIDGRKVEVTFTSPRIATLKDD